MNKKQLTLIGIVALVVGVIAIIVSYYQQRPYAESSKKMGAKLLGHFDINTVSAMRIANSADSVTVEKTGDIWTVKERYHYPANFPMLAGFLRKLEDMKITKPVQVGPSRLPLLDLVPPDKNGKSVRIELKDGSGKVLKNLLLGASHMRESQGGPYGASAYPDGRYIMVDGQPDAIALVADPLTQADPKSSNWINKDWFKVEKLKSITVVSTKPECNWKVSRETESGDWTLANIKSGEQFDKSKGSTVTNAFSWASFNDVTAATPDVTGLDKPTTVGTLETFDGFTYTVKVGKSFANDDNYYCQMSVIGNFPKSRTPVKDEKPEDKEKLEKTFQEKIHKFEQKLKTEQTYSQWTYLVSKSSTLAPLFKERKDLLADKKDQGKEKAPEKPKK